MAISGLHASSSRVPTVALVNNMPDSAFLDTEDQFRLVVGTAGTAAPSDLSLYTLPGLDRSARVAEHIDSRYAPFDALFDAPPDALIVTGTEPSQSSLRYEPYWPQLADLLQWAAATVPSTMLSCLASHASVLLFDGIERVPLRHKRHGVFSATPLDHAAQLTAGMPRRACMPHSRINDVPVEAMLAAGYTIAVDDGGVSWSVATRRTGQSTFVLCQGHPEYSPASLLREYRRDVRRALIGQNSFSYPQVPVGYLDADAVAELERFERAATAPAVDRAAAWRAFPFDQVAERVAHSWAPTARALYANWLRLSAPVRGDVSHTEDG